MKLLIIIAVIGLGIVKTRAGPLDHFFNHFPAQNHILEQKINNSVESVRYVIAQEDPFVIPRREISGRLFNFSFDSVTYSGFSDFALQYLNVDVMQASITASLKVRRVAFEANNIKFKSITSASTIELDKARVIFEDMSFDVFTQFNVIFRRLDALISFARVERIEVYINGHIFRVPVKINGNQPLLVDFFNVFAAELNAFLDVLIKVAVNVALLSI